MKETQQFISELEKLYNYIESHRTKAILVVELKSFPYGLYLNKIINYDIEILDTLLSEKLNGEIVTIDKQVIEYIEIQQYFEENNSAQALLVCLKLNEDLYHNFWLMYGKAADDNQALIFAKYICKLLLSAI